MSDLHTFLSNVNALAKKRDAKSLSRLLCLPLKSAISDSVKVLAMRCAELDVFAYCSSNIKDGDLAPVVANHLAALSSLIRGEYKDAFNKQMVTLATILFFCILFIFPVYS